MSRCSETTLRVTWDPRTKQELIDTARAGLPRELADEKRRRFYLAPD